MEKKLSESEKGEGESIAHVKKIKFWGVEVEFKFFSISIN
jgi:hypothetical protein